MAARNRPPRGARGDATYRRLKQRILDTDYAPGVHVLENTIAADLGVSRTPVREAMVRLAQEGLVEVVPRHGMRVLPIQPTDMREIHQVLSSVEPMATEILASQRPSRTQIAPLIEACDQMEATLKTDDRATWARADAQFHYALAHLCGNRRLTAIVMSMWEQSHRARMFTLRLRPKPTASTREHRKVVDAILAGDSQHARALYQAHRDRAGSAILQIIEQYGLTRL